MESTKNKTLFKQVSQQVGPTLLLVFTIALAFFYSMPFIDHQKPWITYLIVVLALAKTAYFTFYTFRQVTRSIERCHSFYELLSVFGMLVVLVIVSFTADFSCLYAADSLAFQGLGSPESSGYLKNLFDLFYFSVVTFASVGYGDISPVSAAAKLIVMAEIAQSFVLIIFGLSSVNKMHPVYKNENE